jgi:hypothetical protein
MGSNEPHFKHVGLSSDGAVIFCALDHCKTYAMPLCAGERGELEPQGEAQKSHHHSRRLGVVRRVRYARED